MKTKWYIYIWHDGKYFDLWHINHWLAGALFGQLAFYGQNLWLGFLISLAIMILWEIFEILHKITETKFNRNMDIVIGVIGYFIIFGLGQFLSAKSYFILFIIHLALYILLELWGYAAYRSKQLPPRQIVN